MVTVKVSFARPAYYVRYSLTLLLGDRGNADWQGISSSQWHCHLFGCTIPMSWHFPASSHNGVHQMLSSIGFTNVASLITFNVPLS